MAAEIGVSPSYLNHLERNQRPVTAQVLLRLAEAYDVDLKSFAAEGADGTGTDQLAEIFADPMFADLGIPRYELLEVADNAPSVADAVSRLYAALVELRRQPAGEGADDERSPGSRRKPGCATISRRSATISPIWRKRPRRWPARSAIRSAIAEPLRRRLKEGFGIEARIVPPGIARRRQPALRPPPQAADALGPAAGRRAAPSALAYQLALVEFRPLLDADDRGARRRPTRRPGACST